MTFSVGQPRPSGDAGGTGFRPSAVRPEINVTPLVDVVLVLLIIFMVISPQLEVGERVDLPTVDMVGRKTETNAVTVTLTKAGKLMLEKDEVSEAQLQDQLQHLMEFDPTKKLVLKVDRGVKYGPVRTLFATAQAIGFRGVGLLVQESEKAAAEERSAALPPRAP